jgi:hypothetical protein
MELEVPLPRSLGHAAGERKQYILLYLKMNVFQQIHATSPLLVLVLTMKPANDLHPQRCYIFSSLVTAILKEYFWEEIISNYIFRFSDILLGIYRRKQRKIEVEYIL